jgi:hypothetical protein
MDLILCVKEEEFKTAEEIIRGLNLNFNDDPSKLTHSYLISVSGKEEDITTFKKRLDEYRESVQYSSS